MSRERAESSEQLELDKCNIFIILYELIVSIHKAKGLISFCSKPQQSHTNLPVSNFGELHNHPVGEAFDEAHVGCEADKLVRDEGGKIRQTDSVVMPRHQCTARLIFRPKNEMFG